MVRARYRSGPTEIFEVTATHGGRVARVVGFSGCVAVFGVEGPERSLPLTFTFVKCPGVGMEFRINDDPALQFGTGEHMNAVVLRTTPLASNARFYWKNGVGTSLSLEQPNQSTVAYTHGLSTISVNVSTAAPQWYVAMLRGPAMELQVGPGQSSGPQSNVNVDNPGGWVLLCKSDTNQHEIAEIFAVKGPVSDADYDKARQYLEDKYGL